MFLKAIIGTSGAREIPLPGVAGKTADRGDRG
jgi:hypothetical protein